MSEKALRYAYAQARKITGDADSKRFHHDVVGDLDLAYESVDMISDPGLTLTIYAAEPASRTAEALLLLASWTASPIGLRND